jgi:dienelactone hydrolase
MIEYAQFFNAMGVHVLVTDSLTPRGEVELCTQAIEGRRVTVRDRRADLLGALAWLAQQPGVDAKRLGLIGWSHGGSTVLTGVDTSVREVSAATAHPSLAVAFYPGCKPWAQRGLAPSVPLHVLIGEADDWTPAEHCVQMAAASRARAPSQAIPKAITLTAYPGAHHGFDSTAPVRHLPKVPGGANPGQGVHTGGQPEARKASHEALERIVREAWFAPR